MAKYDVTHSCGHSQTHQLFGKHTERERKIAWFEGALCSDCWAEQRDKGNALASAKSAELAQASGLPQLTGTPKQIAWAETLRVAFLKHLSEAIVKARSVFTTTPEERNWAAKGWVEAAKLLTSKKPLPYDSESLVEIMVHCCAASPACIQELDDLFCLIEVEAKAKTESRFWIDHRDVGVLPYFCRQIAERILTTCPSIAALVADAAAAHEVARTEGGAS